MAGLSPTAVGQGSGGDVWCRGSALLAAVWGDGGGAGVLGGGTVCWYGGTGNAARRALATLLSALPFVFICILLLI